MHSTHGSLGGTPTGARSLGLGPSAVGPIATGPVTADLVTDFAELQGALPGRRQTSATRSRSRLVRGATLVALIAASQATLGPGSGMGPTLARAQVLQPDRPAFPSTDPRLIDGSPSLPAGASANLEQTDAQLEQLAADAQANRSAQASAAARTPREMNFFQLLMDGGPLMIPLVLISILVLTVSLERLINLRMSRILPRKLSKGLIEASEQRFPVDPQELYQMGLRYPSVASRVLESMLKKVGRPVPEMEAALQDACQREAERLYGTVRWLTAAAAIAPLLGLLGTVWGMILAFFETTQPGLGINRTQQLAQGISIAFVNTLAGLSIAIPAAGFSHFFEGRIVKVMGVLQELMQTLIPRLERFEGVTRYDLETVGLVPRRRSEAQLPNNLAPPEPTGPTDILSLEGEGAARPRELPRAPTPSLPRSTRGR